MELDREIEKLKAEVEELTDAINTELIRDWNERKEDGLVVDVSLQITQSPSLKKRISDVIKKQMKIKELSHRQLLTCDIDRYICEIINKAQPNPTDVSCKVLAAIKDLPQKIGQEYPQFRCRLVGTGSYYEGTKITALNEMDFIFVIPQSYVSYIVKPYLYEEDGEYQIISQNYSYWTDYCESNGRLQSRLFRPHFELVLGEMLQEVCNEKQLEFSGFASPHFSGLRHNGPALTVQIEGISIDFTLAFQLPQHLMWKVLEERSQPEVLRYVKKYVPNYDRLGLVVFHRDDLRTSTSLLVRSLFRHREVLRKSLIVCKYYDEHLLRINTPSLKQYDNYVIRCIEGDLWHSGAINPDDVIRNYLFGRIHAFEQLDITHHDVWSAADTAMLFFQMCYREDPSVELFSSPLTRQFLKVGSNPWPATVIMLYHAARPKPLTGHVDTLSELQENLFYVQSACLEVINDMEDLNVHSSLAELVGEQIKPAVNTTSHTFKLLILKAFCANINMSVTECVLFVLQRYRELLEASMHMDVTDPFLGKSAELLKKTGWWIKLDIGEIHKRHIVATVRDLQKVSEAAKRSEGNLPTSVTQYTNRQGTSWKQLELFWERHLLRPKTDAYEFVGIGDIVNLDQLGNGDIIVVMNEGVMFCNKLGEIISHPSIKVNDFVFGSERFLDVSVHRRLNKVVILKRTFGLGILYIWQCHDSEWQLSTEFEVGCEPIRVAITRTGHFVIVAGKDGLYKYSTRKKLIWENKSCTRARSLVVDNRDNILISLDRDIWVFNEHGDLASTFSLAQAPLDPHGLCVTDDGSIIVCDSTTKSVLLFNDQYQFIKQVLTLDYVAHCVTAWSNIQLTVSEEGTCKLFTYKPNE